MSLPKKLEPKENLEKVFNKCRRRWFWQNFKTVYMAFLDLNNLKQVNDCQGHLEGDRVIERTVSIIFKNIRNTDKLVRFGGDEFVLFLKDISEKDVYKVINRIYFSIYWDHFMVRNNVSVSIGVSRYKNNFTKSLKKADDLMYYAKRNLKPHVAFEWNKYGCTG